MGRYIGRCISVVHIRRCRAGICQQWLIAEWLGLSVTVRVRVILGLGLGNGYDEILKVDGESILNPLWHCLWLDDVGKWSSLLVSYGQICLPRMCMAMQD